MRIPVSPGRSDSSASSTPSVTVERAGAGELLHDQHQALAAVTEGVTDQRLVVDCDGGHVARGATVRPCRTTGTFPSSAGSAIFSSMCRTCSRCCGVSMNPPVPGVDASRKLSGDTT